jgi:hypothetical protein
VEQLVIEQGCEPYGVRLESLLLGNHVSCQWIGQIGSSRNEWTRVGLLKLSAGSSHQRRQREDKNAIRDCIRETVIANVATVLVLVTTRSQWETPRATRTTPREWLWSKERANVSGGRFTDRTGQARAQKGDTCCTAEKHGSSPRLRILG